MGDSAPALGELRKLLAYGDLPFRDFVEVALYHPEVGYYTRPQNPIGRDADYITGPLLSPVFSFALGRLVNEFLRRNDDGLSTVVDIGCGDGSLIHSLYAAVDPQHRSSTRFVGVDRSVGRVLPAARSEEGLRFVRTMDEVKGEGAHLLISNELFDSFPFARLVQRDEHLHELWVADEEGELSWTEHEAPAPYEDYFQERGIKLDDGQFADISLEWEAYYTDLCRSVERGMIVTFDYGYPEAQLFRFRRFGTAAAYGSQRVTRDLLADPGGQDLTAHINFTDLIRAGERAGFPTLFFERQARFLLSVGAAEHPLLRPLEQIDSIGHGVELLEQRHDAKRLILPDDIGNDIRVLVQAKGIPLDGWSFQRKLF